MAESQSKKRDSDHIRGNSSTGRFFKRRRGQWGHSRASINAALAIAPTTTGAPQAAAASTASTAAMVNGGTVGTVGPIVAGVSTQNLGDGGGKPQRHGRKRRRHRHSSFSGGGGGGGVGDKASSSYPLPPAVAAALAIPPKTPEAPDLEKDNEKNDANEKKMDGQISNGGGAMEMAATNGGSSGRKKKRRSRRKRRQYKPYYKLTAEERRELEEREEKRAERVRAQRFAHGQPVAPYNTTQFLLRDRELRNGGEPDCGDLDEIVRNIRHHTRSGSYESPGAAGASESENGEGSTDNSDYSYLEREFDNDWLDEQRQRLEAMTKDDLVKEFMDLQKQYESAQRDMRSKRLSYEEQIAILQRENSQLRSHFSTNSTTTTTPPSARIAITEGPKKVEPMSESVSDAANCSSSSFNSANEAAVVTLSLG